MYETIPADLLEHVEDVIFNRRPDATERLVKFAATVAGRASSQGADLDMARAQRGASDWSTPSSTVSSSSSNRTSKRRVARFLDRSM